MHKERIEPAQCLLDLEFQDWLAKTDILVRDTQSTLPDGSRFTQDTHVNRFRLRLLETPGFIVPREELASAVFGSQTKEDLEYVSVWGHYIKTTHDAVPYHKARVGWGYGLNDLKLTWDSIPAVYRLWLDLGEAISDKELAGAVYGHCDQGTIKNVNGMLLRGPLKDFPATKADLQRKACGDGSFTYVLEEKKEHDIDDYLSPYLPLEFQDWMAEEDVGLLKRGSSKAKDYLQKIKKTSSYNYRLLSLLENFNGYIVPLNYISYKIFHDVEGDDMRVFSILGHIKEDLGDYDFIYTAINLGVAVGVEDFKISKGNLPVLYRLWRNEGEFVGKKELGNRAQSSSIATRIHQIRQPMADSAYEIVTKRSQGYKLQRT